MGHTEMGVVGWMCGVGPGGRRRGGELGELLGLESVSLVGGMGWDGLDVLGEMMVVAGFGHCVAWEVGRVGQRGRPGAWWDCVGNDVEGLGLSRGMHGPGVDGEGELRGNPANPGSPGKMAIKTECVYVCV